MTFSHSFTAETAAEYFNEAPTTTVASIRLLSSEFALAKLLAGGTYSLDNVDSILNHNGFDRDRPSEIDHAMREFYSAFERAYTASKTMQCSLNAVYSVCITAGVSAIYDFQATDPATMKRIEEALKKQKSKAKWIGIGMTLALTVFTGGVASLVVGGALRFGLGALIAGGLGTISFVGVGYLAILAHKHANRHNNETSKSIMELWTMFHNTDDHSKKLEILSEIERYANVLDGWLKVLTFVKDTVTGTVKPARQKKTTPRKPRGGTKHKQSRTK